MQLLDATRVDVEDHINRNRISNFQFPTHVLDWLEKVEKIKAEVEINIPSGVGSSFNFNVRHKLGRKAFKITEKIDGLMEEENSGIKWTVHPIILGKVVSMKAAV